MRGSAAEPLTLNEAAGLTEHIQPGHTLYLKGGTYKLSQDLSWLLQGTEAAPILITSAPGEWARIDLGDGANFVQLLIEDGSYLTFRDLEIFCSSTATRLWDGTGSFFDTRSFVEVHSPHVRFEGCIIHDTVNFGLWRPALGSTMQDCIIYNQGYILSTAPGEITGGHCLYTQNEATTGLKTITNCILGLSYGAGMYISGSDTAFLQGYRIKDVISFGCRVTRIGGYNNAQISDVEIDDCWFVDTYRIYMRGCTDVSIANSFFALYNQRWQIEEITSLSLQNNTVVSNGRAVVMTLTDGAEVVLDIDNNAYHGDGDAEPSWSYTLAGGGNGPFTLSQWKVAILSDLGLTVDANSTAHVDPPPARQKVVACQASERMIAFCSAWNPNEDATFDFDVSGLGLVQGTTYRIRSAYNWPVVDTFVYDGSGTLTVTFTGRTTALPLGSDVMEPIAEPNPQYGTWIIEHDQ